MSLTVCVVIKMIIILDIFHRNKFFRTRRLETGSFSHQVTEEEGSYLFGLLAQSLDPWLCPWGPAEKKASLLCLPDDGNRSSSRNDVFEKTYDDGRCQK
jgi:hypothetical protein